MQGHGTEPEAEPDGTADAPQVTAEPGRRPWWRRPVAWLAAGVLVTVALVVAFVLVVAGDDDVMTSGDDSSATSSSTAAPTTSSSATPVPPSSTAPPTTSSGSTTPTTPTTAPAGGIDPMTGAGTDPVVVPRPDIPTTHLTAVRVARQEGYDRVVFQFDGDVPGYDVRYVEPPVIEDPSGLPAEVSGSAILAVRMEPASGVDLSGPEYRQTYTGPIRIPGTGAQVTEVVRTGDFEAVLNWAIGLEDRVDVRVSTLTAPSRLVIDVRNH